VTELDLTSFAWGTRQHVFLPTGAPDHEWVYKLPSALGATEHYGMELRGYRPTGPLASVLYRAFVELPHSRHHRRLAQLARRGAPECRLRAAEERYRILCEARGRSLAAAYRWTRRRHFRRMIALAQELAARGLTDAALPFEILVDASAVLRAGDTVERYRGPVLAQLRADFFDRSGRFDAFAWDDVITTQHRLWGHGIGLSDANEILGPKNWALVDGRLKLADLSSLTRNRREVRRLLANDILDERQGRVVERLARESAPEAVALARRYFAYVRKQINPTRFDQLWRPGRAAAIPA
jgi:hypothetical protein